MACRLGDLENCLSTPIDVESQSRMWLPKTRLKGKHVLARFRAIREGSENDLSELEAVLTTPRQSIRSQTKGKERI